MPPLTNHMHEELASLTPILLVLFIYNLFYTSLLKSDTVKHVTKIKKSNILKEFYRLFYDMYKVNEYIKSAEDQ